MKTHPIIKNLRNTAKHLLLKVKKLATKLNLIQLENLMMKIKEKKILYTKLLENSLQNKEEPLNTVTTYSLMLRIVKLLLMSLEMKSNIFMFK